MNRRNWIIICLVAPMTAYAAWVGYIRLCGEPVMTNALVGVDERRIRADYGDPLSDADGYQPLALHMPPSLPTGSIRTLIFHSAGLSHPRPGTLWVWLVERDGQWVCFESCWFADGVVF